MELTKGYKKIGKGAFSSVFRKGDSNNVLIISNDVVKECISLGWFPKSRLFPKIERLSYNDDGTSTYKMKYYDKVIAPKKQLNTKAYRLYKALRSLEVINYPENDDLLHDAWIKAFKNLPSELKTAKGALIGAVEALTNYGADICFEISPRNIATTKTGNLVLLDTFFLKSQLFVRIT